MNKQISIPKTSVIELRQQNKNASVLEDGDFVVNLDKQLVMEEGDSLELKSVYLDTGSVESGFITLEPDATQADPSNPVTTIQITIGKYLMNIPATQEGEFYTTDTASKAIVRSKVRNPKITDGAEQVNGYSDRIRANTDGKPYVMCLQTQNSAGADTQFQVVSFAINVENAATNLAIEPLIIQINYYLPNLPASAATLKSKLFSLNVNNAFSAAKKKEFFSRFDGNSLVVNQDILDTFDNIFAGSDNLGFMTGFNTLPNKPEMVRRYVNPDHKFAYPVTLSGTEEVAVDPNQLHLHPITEDIIFTLPSTRYTSSELAKRITQEASKVNQLGSIDRVDYTSTNSVLYRTIQDEIRKHNPNFQPRATDALGHADLTNGPIVFVETDIPDGQDYRNTFRLNSYKTTDLNYMVGSASGFTLEYDEESDKFSIQNIHSPIRDQNPDSNAIGSPQVRGYAQPIMNGNGLTTNDNRKFYVNKYSGVYITNLEPKNVWRNQMKFNTDLLFPNDKSSGTKFKIGLPPVAPNPDQREEYSMDSDSMKLLDGQHITGTFESVGTAEQHGVSLTEDPATGGGAGAGVKRIVAGTSTFDTIIEFLPATEVAQNDPSESDEPVPYIATNTDQVFNIFSNQQIDDGQHDIADEGYYKIVVDSKVDNELVGADQTIRNVSAIISKYNSYGNFTAAYNEGSVSYIHKGQPLTITDFRVKILLPNGNLATDLNDRNSVFLELTKNQ